jgi:hypothetical protein
VSGFVLRPNAVEAHTTRIRATVVSNGNKKCLLAGISKAHTGFEPVLPEKPGTEPHSGSASEITVGSEPNPHLRAVLERLKERDRERRG